MALPSIILLLGFAGGVAAVPVAALAQWDPNLSHQANSLIVGINVVKLPGGTLSAIVTTSDNQRLNMPPSFKQPTFSGRRSLWREFEAF